MERMTHVEARGPGVLFVRFDDGVEGEVDISSSMTGPVFAPMRDPIYFARVVLADHGAPLWPNGVDIAPDAIHDHLVSVRDGEDVFDEA